MHLLILLTGFVSGFLSGMFGVGGGIVTTPAIRLLLSQPAAIAIGTPIPVMIPSAFVGAYNYNKNKLIDWKLAKVLMISGVIGVILGSYATRFIQPKLIMLATSAVIGVVSISFILPVKSNPKDTQAIDDFSNNKPLTWLVGFLCGVFSGFLGLGGGTLLIPSLVYIFKKDIRSAFGTSLAVVATYTVPGTIVHGYLRHIDFLIALLLTLGVIPGAYAGSKLVPLLQVKLLRFLFGLLLLILAAYFAFFEIKL